MTGKKKDQGKPRYSLVPINAEEEFVKVLTFGADKYSDVEKEVRQTNQTELFERFYSTPAR